nr:MAG TPA: hypothetical protein [Caudoviricetes sp.]
MQFHLEHRNKLKVYCCKINITDLFVEWNYTCYLCG